jgi:hypothetical protein
MKTILILFTLSLGLPQLGWAVGQNDQMSAGVDCELMREAKKLDQAIQQPVASTDPSGPSTSTTAR